MDQSWKVLLLYEQSNINDNSYTATTLSISSKRVYSIISIFSSPLSINICQRKQDWKAPILNSILIYSLINWIFFHKDVFWILRYIVNLSISEWNNSKYIFVGETYSSHFRSTIVSLYWLCDVVQNLMYWTIHVKYSNYLVQCVQNLTWRRNNFKYSFVQLDNKIIIFHFDFFCSIIHTCKIINALIIFISTTLT